LLLCVLVCVQSRARGGSTESSLASLQVASCELVPPFTPAFLGPYTCEIFGPSFYLLYSTTDPSARAVSSCDSLCLVPAEVPTRTAEVVVSSENSTATYEVQVYRSDVIRDFGLLSALTLSESGGRPVELEPPFHPMQHTYAAVVPAGASVFVQAVAVSPGQQLAITQPDPTQTPGAAVASVAVANAGFWVAAYTIDVVWASGDYMTGSSSDWGLQEDYDAQLVAVREEQARQIAALNGALRKRDAAWKQLLASRESAARLETADLLAQLTQLRNESRSW